LQEDEKRKCNFKEKKENTLLLIGFARIRPIGCYCEARSKIAEVCFTV